ncbi:MAG: gamma-glutamyl-gamma-aminobutyrate hydrolase family protein, partial [Actinomycetota bacterium]
MSGPPLIGLPGRRKKGSQIVDFPDILHDLDLDLYFADYGRGVIEAGGLPVNLPIDVDIESVARRLDGVLLTGGTDIDPARYGAQPDPELLAVRSCGFCAIPSFRGKQRSRSIEAILREVD